MNPAHADTSAILRIRTKRIYRAPRNSDGKRILVDRIWPRGMSKERARLHAWMKEIAPSNELRKWYHQNEDHWCQFKQRYFSEIDRSVKSLNVLTEIAQSEVITLLYAGANEKRNNAVVLRQYLLEKMDVGEC